MITLETLRAIMPTLPEVKAIDYLPHLNEALLEGEITTPLREAAFLAQIAHESGELKYFEEIASGQNYEGRKDLGNMKAGDGKRYKGRGPIQLTGRANYRKCGEYLGLPLESEPQIVSNPSVGFRVAVWFWTTRELNKLADKSAFDRITYRINGGYHGKASRRNYYNKAKQVLGIAN